MKLMQFGAILVLVGMAMGDSPNILAPFITILLGMIFIIVGGIYNGGF